MSLDDLLIVSFDGLNRAGKGTQLNMLKGYLESKDYLVEVLRGDGSRPGKGSSDFYDPSSNFWQQWQKVKDKSLDDWTYAADVLAHENYLRCVEIASQSKDTGQKGVILLDRSYISRLYMIRKEDSAVPFESCLKDHTVHPDVYFVLDVPKEVLLTRTSDDDPSKTEFRRRNVSTSYDTWIETINLVSEHIQIYKLDGTKDQYSLHNEVKQIVDEGYRT
jgi:thymidylate kinase